MDNFKTTNKVYETNLRELPEEIPLGNRSVTLLLIRGSTIIQAKNIGENRMLAQIMEPKDIILCAWTGQWSTDVFFLPQDKIPFI